MTLYKCKECGQNFGNEKGLLGHLKKHDISVGDYYANHLPRFDLYTHKPIIFKSTKQYLESDFNSHSNFNKWCDKENPIVVKKYIVDKMRAHMKEKGRKTILGHVQMKSYKWPDMVKVEELFGTLSEFFREVGAPAQFPDCMTNKFDEEDDSLVIWIDTREQKPLSFINPTKNIKIDCGDYTMGGDAFDHTFVDRKSGSDFISTMTAGYERFQREMKRCESIGGYMFIVVECSMERIEKELTLSKSKSTAARVWHNMRELLTDFDGGCQFVFSGGRAQSSLIIPKILICGKEIWKTDVQYYLDRE